MVRADSLYDVRAKTQNLEPMDPSVESGVRLARHIALPLPGEAKRQNFTQSKVENTN